MDASVPSAPGNVAIPSSREDGDADVDAGVDAAVTRSGISTAALVTGNDADFGAGPDGIVGDAGVSSSAYFVQFDPSGNVTFRRKPSSTPGSDDALLQPRQLVTDETGTTLWATGWNNVGPYIVGFTPSGAVDWSEPFAADGTLIATGP